MKRLLLILCALLLLTGCTPAVKREADLPKTGIVTINAITLGTAPAGGLDSLYAELDNLTIPELGCKLRFTYIPWGDERNQLNIAIASGEYDIIPQGSFSDYQLMASRNAFLDIKPYLYLVPDLVAHYQRTGEDVLAYEARDGKLFGIPQYGEPGTSANEGFFYREDLRIAWGLEPVDSLESMEAYLYRAKEDAAFSDRALITDNRIWTSLWEQLAKDVYLEAGGYIVDMPYAVVRMDEPYKVVNRLETPEFRTVLRYVTKWYQDGILDKRLLTLSGNEGTSGRAMMMAGEKPCETNSPLWTINRDWIPALLELYPDWVFGFYSYSGDGVVMNYKTSAGGSSKLCISSRTKYPEICIRLLEKLHTDQRYYDLLLYGIEGEHYHLQGEAVSFDGIAAENRYVGWTTANDGYMQRDEASMEPSQWTREVYEPLLDMFADYTESAEFHPLNHFSFDFSSVNEESVALAETWNTYMMPLLCGMAVDIDAELTEAISKLKEAGLDEYLAELQRQLTAYKESNESEVQYE